MTSRRRDNWSTYQWAIANEREEESRDLYRRLLWLCIAIIGVGGGLCILELVAR